MYTIFLSWHRENKKVYIAHNFLARIYSSMKKLFLLGIFWVMFFAWCAQQTPTENLDTFAQCITKKWAVLYGAKTCPHCLEQRKMFGDSVQYVDYVECTEEYERCADLKWVPVWKFADWSQVEGRQSFSTLAEKTHCTLPESLTN